MLCDASKKFWYGDKALGVCDYPKCPNGVSNFIRCRCVAFNFWAESAEVYPSSTGPQSNMCLVGQVCDSVANKCTYPVCPNVDATKAFDANLAVGEKCKCGTTDCVNGEWCNEATNSCGVGIECASKDGTELVPAFNSVGLPTKCDCGSVVCQVTGNGIMLWSGNGVACDVSLNKCDVPKCPNGDGTQLFVGIGMPNTNEQSYNLRCKCGTSICDANRHPSVCYKTLNRCQYPQCESENGSKQFKGFSSGPFKNDIWKEDGHSTQQMRCSCGTTGSLNCRVDQVCNSVANTCTYPICPNEDGTKQFDGKDSNGNVIGDKCKCGTRDCVKGQLCNSASNTCEYPACPITNGTAIFDGNDSQGAEIISNYADEIRCHCKYPGSTIPSSLHPSCLKGEVCRTSATNSAGRCSLPSCPKNGTLFQGFLDSNGVALSDTCVCEAVLGGGGPTCKLGNGCYAQGCGYSRCPMDLGAHQPNLFTGFPGGDSTTQFGSPKLLNGCQCGDSKINSNPNLQKICRRGQYCTFSSSTCEYPICPKKKEVFVPFTDRLEAKEQLCKCESTDGERSCRVGQACHAAENRCGYPKCESTDGKVPFDGTDSRGIQIIDENDANSPRCSCLETFTCSLGQACLETTESFQTADACVTPKCPNEDGTVAFEGFAVSKKGPADDPTKDTSECRCTTRGGTICKVGQFCSPKDSGNANAASSCEKLSKDDMAAAKKQEEADQKNREKEQNERRQKSGDHYNGGGSGGMFGLDMGLFIGIVSVGGCLLLTCCCCVVYFKCRKSTPKPTKNTLANSGSNNHVEVEMPAVNMMTSPMRSDHQQQQQQQPQPNINSTPVQRVDPILAMMTDDATPPPSNVGFVIGMKVCVLEKGTLRDGEVMGVSAEDGVAVKFTDGEEDEYTPKKLKKMIIAGSAEKERLAKNTTRRTGKQNWNKLRHTVKASAAFSTVTKEKKAVKKRSKQNWSTLRDTVMDPEKQEQRRLRQSRRLSHVMKARRYSEAKSQEMSGGGGGGDDDDALVKNESSTEKEEESPLSDEIAITVKKDPTTTEKDSTATKEDPTTEQEESSSNKKDSTITTTAEKSTTEAEAPVVTAPDGSDVPRRGTVLPGGWDKSIADDERQVLL